MRGDHGIIAREHARADARKLAAEFHHAANGEFFICEEKGLERLLFRNVRAGVFSFENQGLDERLGRWHGRETMKSRQAVDQLDESLGLIAGGCGILNGSRRGRG